MRIAQGAQFLRELRHIAVFRLGENIVQGKDSARLHYPQRLHQNRLSVGARNVVIYIVAHHSVKALVRKIQLHRVSLPELRVVHALSTGVFLAKRLAERGVFLPPAINAEKAPLRIPFGTGNGQRPAAATHVQPNATVRDGNIRCKALYDLSGQLPSATVRKGAVQRRHPDGRHCADGSGQPGRHRQHGFQPSGRQQSSASEHDCQRKTHDGGRQHPEHHALWHPVLIIRLHDPSPPLSFLPASRSRDLCRGGRA